MPTASMIRRGVARTPIDGARITSIRCMRTHPILGYQMHRYVDFWRASTGDAPIYAAGNGVVEENGQKSGFGNFAKIPTTGTYETAYGHCSCFLPRAYSGRSGEAGEVIAYRRYPPADRPHLHFEVLLDGSQVNPEVGQVDDGRQPCRRRLGLSRRRGGDDDACSEDADRQDRNRQPAGRFGSGLPRFAAARTGPSCK